MPNPTKPPKRYNVDSVLAANRNVPFVDQIINADKYPVRKNRNGSASSNIMSWAQDDKGPFAYPTLRLVNNKWVENESPSEALKSGDVIRFKDEADAASFAENYKKANISKIKTGKPLNEDEEVLDYVRTYVQSPKYKERLSAFYKYPDLVQMSRDKRLAGLKVTTNESSPATQYWEAYNEASISPIQLQALQAKRSDAVPHEIGHAINNSRSNKAHALSIAEQKYILDRNKKVGAAKASEIINRAAAFKEEPRQYLDKGDHDINPAESISDVQAFRFLLNKRGIYDARKADITPEQLQKAKKDPVLKKSFTLKRLMENFNDKELIEIMNKVATNTSNNKSNLA